MHPTKKKGVKPCEINEKNKCKNTGKDRKKILNISQNTNKKRKKIGGFEGMWRRKLRGWKKRGERARKCEMKDLFVMSSSWRHAPRFLLSQEEKEKGTFFSFLGWVAVEMIKVERREEEKKLKIKICKYEGLIFATAFKGT